LTKNVKGFINKLFRSDGWEGLEDMLTLSGWSRARRDCDRFSVGLGTKSAIDRGRKTQRYFEGAVEFPVLQIKQHNALQRINH